MKEGVLLSYILPCYNTGKYIKQCVESLLEQGLDTQEYEILCVNNASTDNTAEILDNLSLSISNLRVITLSINKCSGGAYNAGLEVAKGKYVLFVDSDDYLKKGKMCGLCKIMEEEKLQMLQFNLTPFRNTEKTVISEKMIANGNIMEEISACDGEEFLKESIRQMHFSYFPVPAYRKVFLRSFLLDNSLFFTPTTIGTDFLHTMRCLVVVKRIKSICDKIYYYRYNPMGVSKVKVTKAKIDYALNNYVESFECVKNSHFSDSLKKLVLDRIKIVIQSYIGEITELTEADRKDLLDKLTIKNALADLSRSFIQRSLFENYNLYSILNKVLYRKVLKRL